MKNIIVSASLIRVSDDHILDLFVGDDESGKPCIVLFTNNTPTNSDVLKLKSSKAIEVKIRQRTDGLYSVTFSLCIPSMFDLFGIFVNDLTESSSRIASEQYGLAFIARRYAAWKDMFEKHGGQKLTLSEVKGLIGELLFLRDFMLAKYGYESAVSAWIGPEGADQDFRINKTWYEVKSTVSGNKTIKISSIEQLDSPDVGFLVLMFLDKTSINDSHSVTLNSIVNSIKTILADEGCQEIFEEKLLRYGYFHLEEYDKYCFSFSRMVRFRVDDSFPALRRKDIKFGEIVNAEYLIETGSIPETK